MPEFGQYIQKCSELKTSLSGIFVYIVQTRRLEYNFGNCLLAIIAIGFSPYFINMCNDYLLDSIIAMKNVIIIVKAVVDPMV